MTATTMPFPDESRAKSLRPLPLFESILLFGIPAILLAVSLWWLWPLLTGAGLARPSVYVLSLTLVNAGLMVAALVGYHLEGNPWTWSAFSERMRLSRMTGRIWLWTLGGTLLFGALALAINFIAQKTKNTWPGMVNHLIINGAGVLMAAL